MKVGGWKLVLCSFFVAEEKLKKASHAEFVCKVLKALNTASSPRFNSNL